LDEGEEGLKEVQTFVDAELKKSLKDCGMRQLGKQPIYFHQEDKHDYKDLGL
jgi:hypothetical protein